MNTFVGGIQIFKILPSFNAVLQSLAWLNAILIMLNIIGIAKAIGASRGKRKETSLSDKNKDTFLNQARSKVKVGEILIVECAF